jgi:hypothetical protein
LAFTLTAFSVIARLNVGTSPVQSRVQYIPLYKGFLFVDVGSQCQVISLLNMDGRVGHPGVRPHRERHTFRSFARPRKVQKKLGEIQGAVFIFAKRYALSLGNRSCVDTYCRKCSHPPVRQGYVGSEHPSGWGLYSNSLISSPQLCHAI